MAKFYGVIGYCQTVEDPDKPGVWESEITEKHYYGDILQTNRRTEESGYLNDNVNISNRISIVADPFAFENLGYMRYAVWRNVKWTITGVEVQEHRLILTLGGVYNE